MPPNAEDDQHHDNGQYAVGAACTQSGAEFAQFELASQSYVSSNVFSIACTAFQNFKAEFKFVDLLSFIELIFYLFFIFLLLTFICMFCFNFGRKLGQNIGLTLLHTIYYYQ